MPQLWVLPFVLAASTASVSPPRQAPAHDLFVPQSTVQIAPRVASDTTPRVSVPIFTRRDVWLAGAFLATTAAFMPFDQPITEEFRDPWPQQRAVFRDLANGFNVVGSPGVLVGSVAAYGIGRAIGSPRVAAVGLYSTEAIAVSGAVTALIKGVAGRARPYVNDNDPDSFAFDRGFRDGDSSFPSGHATAAFAAAAVISGESARWWPHAARIITPVAYGSAVLVGLARIYSNKHWTSDVVMGAGIGTLAGLAVVHFNEAHPHNLVNRWLLGASFAPERYGARVAWTIPTR